MDGSPYERLSFLDNSFLALESRTTHMHVAGTAIFDARPLSKNDGGIDFERIRGFIESKLHLIPRYRQRLAYIPIERHPVWIDDADFSIDYHVRHVSLPRPGTDAQLKRLIGRAVSQPLDRHKPLWELFVVEGLDGDRFAVVTKIHHCMIDGVAGVDLMAMLLDMAPTQSYDPAPDFAPRPAPGGGELLVREAARRTGRVLSGLHNMPKLVTDAGDLVGELTRRVRAVGQSLGSGWLTPTGATPVNGTVGPNRRFEWLDLSLDEVKEVKNALGGTVNDVVLATVSGAIRRFLTDERKFSVRGLEFRVMAPVSVRGADRQGTLGNQVAMWLAALPVSEPNRVRRLRKVTAETAKLKDTDQALGAATIVQMSSGAPATLVSLASRLAASARPFNMTVTNVPGPQFPLYLLESRLLATYPLVPLWESHGLGIALFSYDATLFWGINADWDLVPDLDVFAAAIRDEFAELLADARRTAAKGKPAATTRTKGRSPAKPSGVPEKRSARSRPKTA